MSIKDLNIFFNPRRIAVIGACEEKESIGYFIFKNLIGKGYKGTVYPVHPERESIQGVQAYKTITDIPQPVDLALVANQPEKVLTALHECGEKGVKGMIMLAPDDNYRIGHSGDFSEQITKIASSYGCRILGPNSLGFLRPGINLNASLYPEMPPAGNIAFISEGGIFPTVFMERAISKQVGFSHFISLGSKLDINFSDIIDFLGSDTRTRAIFLHLRKIRNGRRFMAALRSFANTKPIVVVKSGKVDRVSLLPITDSGSLAKEDLIYDAVFKRAGCLRVNDMVDLLYMVEATAKQKRPGGNRLLIISNSVAPSEMAIDALKEMDGVLADISQATLKVLGEKLAIERELFNPVFLRADASAGDYETAIEACLQENTIDGVLLICIPFPGIDLKDIAEKIVSAAKKNPGVPFFATWCGEQRAVCSIKLLNDNGIPTYFTPVQAVKSFIYMYRYDYNLKLLRETPEVILEGFKPDFDTANSIIATCLEQRRFSLTVDESAGLLKAYGIRMLERVKVKNENEAVRTAQLLGYPVVMKIHSAKVCDKFQKGGVLANLTDERKICDAFKILKSRILDLDDPEAQIIVQPMMNTIGYLLAVGAKKSMNFGTVIVFGLGGEYLKAEKDFSIGLPPLNQTLARRLMEETNIYRYFQNIPSFHLGLKYLEEVLIQFSHLVIDLPQIEEIDINPILLTEERGIILDADIHLDKSLPKEYRWTTGDLCPLHLSIPPYPFKYEKDCMLKDGTSLKIRPVRGEDEPELRHFLESLTDQSFYFRFCQQRNTMPHEYLARFCQIDYDRDLGFFAISHDSNEIIGDVRLNRFADQELAELSFVVGDQWQGKGVGALLMQYCLAAANEIGVKMLIMEILTENRKMIEFGRKFGFELVPFDEDEEMVEMTLHIEKSSVKGDRPYLDANNSLISFQVG